VLCLLVIVTGVCKHPQVIN